MTRSNCLKLIILFLLAINTAYLLRGFIVYPYPAGDGLTRWLYVGKTIYVGSLQSVDDYPLLVPLVFSLSSLNLSVFILPYLLLTAYCLLVQKKPLLVLPLLTLPLFEQMSGRGMAGFADHFLAVFIAFSLLAAEKKRFFWAVFFSLLAAHTKNEGQLFSLLFFLFYFRGSPLIWLIPLNILLWRYYLLTQNLIWFYLNTPSTPFSFSLLVSRALLLLRMALESVSSPFSFSLAAPTLFFTILSLPKLTRPQLLLFFLALIYFITFLFTPTSIDLPSHFAVAVDRLWLHLLIPLYLLTLPQLF